MEKLIEQLLACTYALEYAAWNYGTMKLEDLKPNIIESTGVAETCLIEVRNTKMLIEEVRASQKVNTGDRQLTIPDVSQQRELLRDLTEWFDNNQHYNYEPNNDTIERFLSRNSG